MLSGDVEEKSVSEGPGRPPHLTASHFGAHPHRDARPHPDGEEQTVRGEEPEPALTDGDRVGAGTGEGGWAATFLTTASI